MSHKMSSENKHEYFERVSGRKKTEPSKNKPQNEIHTLFREIKLTERSKTCKKAKNTGDSSKEKVDLLIKTFFNLQTFQEVERMKRFSHTDFPSPFEILDKNVQANKRTRKEIIDDMLSYLQNELLKVEKTTYQRQHTNGIKANALKSLDKHENPEEMFISKEEYVREAFGRGEFIEGSNYRQDPSNKNFKNGSTFSSKPFQPDIVWEINSDENRPVTVSYKSSKIGFRRIVRKIKGCFIGTAK